MSNGKDPETGRFTAGNRFWEAKSTFIGHPKLFENGETLKAAITEYLDWNDANPLMAAELVKFEGKATIAELPKMRALTLQGLFMFLGINPKTWWDWRQNRDDLADAIQWAEAVIYRQKFEGAAADMLNQAIIARELGLVDKQDHSGTIKAEVTADAAFAQLASLLGGAIPGAQGSTGGSNSLAEDSEG